jgi:hypothetical protein
VGLGVVVVSLAIPLAVVAQGALELELAFP